MTSTKKSRDDTPASSSSTTSPKLSTIERNCKTIPAPPSRVLDIGDLFSNASDPKDKPNLEKLKQHIILEGRLTEKVALRIIETGAVLLREEPTLLYIDAPLTICGDIHGQLYDLVKLVKVILDNYQMFLFSVTICNEGDTLLRMSVTSVISHS
ncbi:unnamed protein product [Rotaria sp. Silwood2]|nr:unnamed protein product [Rotaria sp. Silwood2]